MMTTPKYPQGALMTPSIEEALRSGAVRLVPVEPDDKMMVMGGFRFAGKVPNSLVFKEVRKGWDDMLSASPDHTPALVALIEERDRLKVERNEARAGQGFAVGKANEYSQSSDDWARRALAAEAERDALREALEPFGEAGRMAAISGRPPGEHVDANAFSRARALTQETNNGE